MIIIMGGCLDKPKVKKPTVIPNNPKSAQSSSKIQPNRHSLNQEVKKVEQPKPKYKSMSINELLTTYRIEGTLELSSKMEGPKFISNLIDGSSKVLRIVNIDQINQKRLQAYKKVLGFQTFQNDYGCIMILDEYCAGEDIYQLVESSKNEEKTTVSKTILSTFLQVAKIISEFHKIKVWLGNLQLSSFRRISAFSEQLRLVDINLSNQVGEHQKMGFAHKDSIEADYQFLGFLLQFIVCDQPPLFIPHKMQYVEFQSIPYSPLVQKLLKGNPLTQEQLFSIKAESIVSNSKVIFGYKFRRDINKLLKMRKKRKPHNKNFYGQDMKGIIIEGRFQEDAVYRLETERIFSRIQSYIEHVRIIHQESFINYAGNNESLRRLKEVFLLTEKQKKMGQLKECLSTIK